MTARPIRRNAQTPDRNGKIFYTSTTSLSHISKDERGVLAQYLQHLELRYQNWFPIKKLSEIEITEGNATLIDKRITALIQNCCKNSDDAKKYSGRYIIPIDNNYATEAQVSVNYETKDIEVEIWVGDTKSQGYIYFTKVAKDLQWIYDTQLGIGAQHYPMNVRPYFRFAHFQSTITSEFLESSYCDENYETDKVKWLELWQKVSREWKRDEWPKLKAMLTKELDGIINNDQFLEHFYNSFEQSNRSYVHVSLGFWVTISIPNDIVRKKENASSLIGKKKDDLAELVNAIVYKVMNKIV